MLIRAAGHGPRPVRSRRWVRSTPTVSRRHPPPTPETIESSSILGDIANLIGETFGDRLGSLREGELRKKLMAAGMYRLAPRKLLGYQVLFGLALPLLWLGWRSQGGVQPLLAVAGIVGMALFGWVGSGDLRQEACPPAPNRDRVQACRSLIDVLVVTVEAGLAFSASLRVWLQTVWAARWETSSG